MIDRKSNEENCVVQENNDLQVGWVQHTLGCFARMAVLMCNDKKWVLQTICSNAYVTRVHVWHHQLLPERWKKRMQPVHMWSWESVVPYCYPLVKLKHLAGQGQDTGSCSDPGHSHLRTVIS